MYNYNKQEVIDEFNNNSVTSGHIDIEYIVQDCYYLGDLEEAVYDYIRESCDIIYYSNAIEYLSEHDCSLRDSLELASDLGYDAESLNSEILATLLFQNHLITEAYSILNAVELIDEEDEE